MIETRYSDGQDDLQVLNQIDNLFCQTGETPFDERYDPYIYSLSFTCTMLDDADIEELKTAWSKFLIQAFDCETSWEWPVNLAMAQWYQSKGMLAHAIAVYEHLYTEIRGGELREYQDVFQECLTSLFQVCEERGMISRARHVAELIGDYYQDGLIDAATYAEVLAIQGALKYREMGRIINEDRDIAKQRLFNEHGSLLNGLHPPTVKLIIEAEVWSHFRVLGLDPSAAPLCWTLAIEAEFHSKVFRPYRQILENAFDTPPKKHQSCSIGQILHLIGNYESKPFMRSEYIRSGAPTDFISEENRNITKIINEHREQFAHITQKGIYTSNRCKEFLRIVRDSGWIFRFLKSLQPN